MFKFYCLRLRLSTFFDKEDDDDADHYPLVRQNESCGCENRVGPSGRYTALVCDMCV